MTTLPHHLRSAAACAALAVALAACGSDEEQAPSEDHTPVSYTVLIDDTPVTPPLTLNQGESVRVRLKFFNAEQEDLDEVEASHFGGLTFDPTDRATVARVAGHNFQFDVTGGTPGNGTVVVSYGHDEAADETAFPAVDITVQPPPGPVE